MNVQGVFPCASRASSNKQQPLSGMRRMRAVCGRACLPMWKLVATVSVNAIIPEYWTEWTYTVPAEMRGTVANGQLVWVPLREKVVLGVVVEISRQEAMAGLKAIHAIVEPTFCLTPRQLNLGFLDQRAVLLLALPCRLADDAAGRRAARDRTYRLTAAGRAADSALLTPTQRQIIALLDSHSDDAGASLTELRAALGGALTSVLAALRKRGLIAMDARIKQERAPTAKRIPYARAILGLEFEAPLTAPKQQAALDYLRRRARLGTPSPGNLPDGAVTIATFRAETGLGAPILKRLVDRRLIGMGAKLPSTRR